MAPGKASVREARDREAGEKVLRRLVPDLAPAPPVEVRRHEGTLEERVKRIIEDDPSTADAVSMFPVDFVRCIREEIDDTILGVDGPDFSCAFRHGRLDARQVLSTLQEIFPDLAGEALFAKAVFLELFQIDPSRAADLLAGLAPAERASWLMDGFSNNSGFRDPFSALPTDRCDPPTLLAWTDLAVANQVEDYEMFSGSQMAALAGKYWNEYGNDYPNRLLDQPPTKGREMMLNILVSALEGKEPAAGAALKKRLSTR